MGETVDKVMKALEDLDSLKQQAINELLDERKNIDEQLAKLGHGVKQAASTKRMRDPNKLCPVCGEKGHDARRHRGEQKTKGKKKRS